MDASLHKRVLRELNEMQKDPAEGIRLLINEQNITEVQAELDGPVGTPYEGGMFKVRLTLPTDYPSAPPKGFFMTKIFHPNVGPSGDICVNVLKKDWTPDLGIRHVLVVIKCLLVHTNPESALNEEAGRLLLTDYEEFARHAKLMTSIHAQRRSGPLTASGGNTTAQTALVASDPTDKQGSTSPAAKKAKADQTGATLTTQHAPAAKTTVAAAGKVKKSLKRL